jgi:hypothetical protein
MSLLVVRLEDQPLPTGRPPSARITMRRQNTARPMTSPKSIGRMRMSPRGSSYIALYTKSTTLKGASPVAAVVSAEDLHRLEKLDAERDRDFPILDEIGRAFKDVPHDELESEVRHALPEVRAQTPAERKQDSAQSTGIA